MSEVVNQDYIAVVKQENTGLSYSEVPTQYDRKCVRFLQQAIFDDSLSFLDIQQLVLEKYGLYKNKEYKYASTHNYCDAFIAPVKIPEFVTGKEYLNLLKKHMDIDITGQAEREREADRELKQDYVDAVTRFIYAKAYCDTCKDIIARSDTNSSKIRVISTETSGWDVRQFNVTNDIKIIIRTNFCYGASSYMNFSFKYKDVLITPYSDYITYYYANMYSIIKCTRDYNPCRNNWKHMLEFIVELCNMATNDYETFIHKWLIDEIDKMIKGLLDIYNNTSSYVKKFSQLSNKEIDYSYIRISLISGMSHRNIMVSDDEVELSFLSEKLTGALRFIENLKSASLLGIDESEAANTIIQLNISILTRLETCIGVVEQDIERLTPIVKELETAFDEAEAAVIEYRESLKKSRKCVEILHDSLKKSQYTNKELDSLLSMYIKKDKAYLDLKEKEEKARIAWTTESIQLNRRERFKKELDSYVEQINRYKDTSL